MSLMMQVIVHVLMEHIEDVVHDGATHGNGDPSHDLMAMVLCSQGFCTEIHHTAPKKPSCACPEHLATKLQEASCVLIQK